MDNNNKILKSGRVNGNNYDEAYAVTASIKINSDVKPQIIVYSTKNGERESDETSNWDSRVKLSDMNPKFSIFKNVGNNTSISGFSTTANLKTSEGDVVLKKVDSPYTITCSVEGTDEKEKTLRNQLMVTANGELSETIKNNKATPVR